MADLLLALIAAAAGLLLVVGAWQGVGGWLGTRQPALVASVGLAAGAGAAVADGAPTGHEWLDLVLRAAFGLAVALAAARARRRALLLATAVAAATSPADPWVLMAAFGILGATVGASASGRRSRLVAAVTGAVLVNVLLRLSWPTRPLATAAVAALAVGLVVLSAVPRLRRRTRRRALALLGGVLVLVLAAGGAYGVAATRARDDVARAVAATDAGLDLAQQGENGAAVERFDEAVGLLDDVERSLGAWWATPFRYVPVAAQQARAVDALVTTASDVLGNATEVVREADVDRVRPREGRIDLDALRSFVGPLEQALAAFDVVPERLAPTRSPWLVPFLDDQLDGFERRAGEARRDSAVVLDAARNLPWLLGDGGQRRWLLAVATPSELRGGGGFVGNWGILTATDGRLELPVFDRITTLYRDEPYGVAVDPEYDLRYLERFGLDRWPQNVFVSPHLPASAVAARQVLESAGVGSIDGVLVVDPFGVAALLALTGPVEVPGWPVPLTSENAASVLLHEQYLDEGEYDREAFLASTTRVLFDALTSGDLPSPRTIADVLGPAVAQKRIQAFAFDEEAQSFLRRTGIDARLQRPVGDGLGLVAHNAAPSKIDWFLRRSVTYDLEVAADGRATGEVEVRLRNTAPSDLPDNGYLGEPELVGVGGSRLMTSLYTTLRLQELTVDGQPMEPDPSRERGYLVYDRFVDIPPGGEVVLRYRLAGQVRLVAGGYRLDVHRQPTSAPDDLLVRVNGDVLFDGEHDRDLVLDAAL